MSLVGTLMPRVAPERSREAVEAATCLFEALLCYLWGDTNPNELVETSKAAFFPCRAAAHAQPGLGMFW